MINNIDLLQNQFPEDVYCLSVRIGRETADELVLEVVPDDPAVLIDYKKNDQDFNILHIRAGEYPDLRLLSGGLLMFNEENISLAMGERNSASVDPGCWTNIVSGRCDRYWEDHIKNELAEEWLAFGFLEKEDCWVRLIETFTGIEPFPVPPKGYRGFFSFPEKFLTEPVEIRIDENGDFLSLNRKPFWKKIRILWPARTEAFSALVYRDKENYTIELRQPALVNLKRFSKKRIFYREGSGQADWFPLQELLYFRGKEKLNEEYRFTPLIRFFIDGMGE